MPNALRGRTDSRLLFGSVFYSAVLSTYVGILTKLRTALPKGTVSASPASATAAAARAGRRGPRCSGKAEHAGHAGMPHTHPTPPDTAAAEATQAEKGVHARRIIGRRPTRTVRKERHAGKEHRTGLSERHIDCTGWGRNGTDRFSRREIYVRLARVLGRRTRSRAGVLAPPFFPFPPKLAAACMHVST